MVYDGVCVDNGRQGLNIHIHNTHMYIYIHNIRIWIHRSAVELSAALMCYFHEQDSIGVVSVDSAVSTRWRHPCEWCMFRAMISGRNGTLI